MNQQAEQKSENDSQRTGDQREGESRYGLAPPSFIDNRPTAALQRKLQNTAQASPRSQHTAQLQSVIQNKENNTGLPDNLKSGIESLSGMSMDHVKVHYNSSQAAQLGAYAYAQGSDIHVGPGQEQYLPHEAWHVVQQAQGRVQPTRAMAAGVDVNDDEALENEADLMGAFALALGEDVNEASGNGGIGGMDASPLAADVTQRAAAAPDSGNAADYDEAELEVTSGGHASTAAEVKVTIANKNKKSEPDDPVKANYMLQNFGDNYKKISTTTTKSSTGKTTRPYVPTAWEAYFCRDLNKGTSLTRTHIVHHSFAKDANNNGHNIVWANAWLNNSMYKKGTSVRSIADREHEDRDELSTNPFGSGNTKLVDNLYDPGLIVRPYGSSWYTDDPDVGVTKTVVPASLAQTIYPTSSKVWKLSGGDLVMWYEAVPQFETGFNYTGQITKNMQTAYSNRIDAQHDKESLGNKSLFASIGKEVAESYASSFTISSQFYSIKLKSATGVKTPKQLSSVVTWVASTMDVEVIDDGSTEAGGMQVQMTYAEKVPASSTTANVVKGAIEEFSWW